MSSENKTLQETIGESVKEQETVTDDTQTVETSEELSTTETTDETKSGDTPDYVSGVDISDVPEQDRERIRELLSKKGKLLESGYNDKFKEVADLKRATEDLQALGLSAEEATTALKNYASNKNKPVDKQQEKASNILDKLISETKPYNDGNGNIVDTRPQLEQMRQIIQQETNVTELKKTVADLQTLVKGLAGESTVTKQSKAETYIDGLSEEFGADIVTKYKDKMLTAHLKHNIPLDSLVGVSVPMTELKQAILTKGKKPLTKEKRDAISSATGGVTKSGEKLDVKSKPLKGLIQQLLTKV